MPISLRGQPTGGNCFRKTPDLNEAKTAQKKPRKFLPSGVEIFLLALHNFQGASTSNFSCFVFGNQGDPSGIANTDFSFRDKE